MKLHAVLPKSSRHGGKQIDLFKNRYMYIAYIECFGRNNAIIENRKDIYARDNLAVTVFVSIILCYKCLLKLC